MVPRSGVWLVQGWQDAGDGDGLVERDLQEFDGLAVLPYLAAAAPGCAATQAPIGSNDPMRLSCVVNRPATL